MQTDEQLNELVDSKPTQEREGVNRVPWDTLLPEQQIERMRGILKDLEHTIEWHSRRFQELSDQIRDFEGHAHTDGKVMIPVTSKRRDLSGGERCKSAKVPGWF